MIDEVDDLLRPDIHSSSMEYRQRFKGEVGAWFLQTQNQITEDFISEHLDQKPPGSPFKVIDFGGGHGQNIEVCNELGAELTVLASDQSCFEIIDQEHNQRSYQKHLGSLLDSDLEPDSYDIVLSYRMLPHLGDWKGHIRETCRVAKQSVIVEFPNRKSVNLLSDKLFAVKKGVEGNTRAFVLFDLNSVRAEFEQNGFELQKVNGQYLWPMVLHRMLKNRAISRALEKIVGFVLPRNKFGSPLICKFSVIKQQP